MGTARNDVHRAVGGNVPGAWPSASKPVRVPSLWHLEQAWRDAEEIAAISDNLLLPKGTSRFLARHSEDK